jgi:hypothetical protein
MFALVLCPVVLGEKASVRDVHEVDHAAVTHRPTALHRGVTTAEDRLCSFPQNTHISMGVPVGPHCHNVQFFNISL